MDEESGQKRVSWLPLVTWVFGVIIITALLLFFYKFSPTIITAYLVIVFSGFYILWRSRKRGIKTGKNKNDKSKKAVPVRGKRK